MFNMLNNKLLTGLIDVRPFLIFGRGEWWPSGYSELALEATWSGGQDGTRGA